MHPRGYYFYAMQQPNKANPGRTDGEAKVAVRSDEPMAGMFLRLGVAMALVIAAVATVTALAG